MSKSKNNGIDPQTLIDRYGADTVRLYTMFAAPPEQSLEWSDSAVEGAFRFLRGLWRLTFEHVARGPAGRVDPRTLDAAQQALRRKIHETIAKVTDDISRRYKFNTAIASVMELVNALGKASQVTAADRAVMQEGLETCTLLLAPIVPHSTEAMWAALGHADPLVATSWPQPEGSALVRDEVELVVQVNGRKRGEIRVAADADAASAEAAALADPNVLRFLEGVTVRKVVVVPGRLVNIVAN
jgi:leucyl-tRNA synthetase